MKILLYCPNKPKAPYKRVIEELARRAKVELRFGKMPKLENWFKVLLDPNGKEIGLETFRELIKGKEKVVFIVGGPEGIEADADFKLSLGKFVLNHQIAMIVLLEQVFRALNPEHPYNRH